MRYLHKLARLLAPLAALGAAGIARADEPLTLGLAYTGDVVGVVSGGADSDPRYLDNLDLTADADLERIVGWKGATAHLHVLSNLGACSKPGWSRILAGQRCAPGSMISTANSTPANPPAC